MENSTWLMFRALQQNAVESRSAYMLLMELSRYAQDNDTATRIWEVAQGLMENAETLQRISLELQSGVLCSRDCKSRSPKIEPMGMFSAPGPQQPKKVVPITRPE